MVIDDLSHEVKCPNSFSVAEERGEKEAQSRPVSDQDQCEEKDDKKGKGCLVEPVVRADCAIAPAFSTAYLI